MSTTTRPRAARTGPVTTTDQVWRELGRASFAVIGHNTATGHPRSSGVVYTMIDRHMYVVTGADSWKARQIAGSGRVAVTVPVRRGGLMSLMMPIPPATVSFHATAAVHAADSPEGRRVVDRLGRLLPVEGRADCRIIEISPEGHFLTYGIGVPLMRMRQPALSRARVPVA